MAKIKDNVSRKWAKWADNVKVQKKEGVIEATTKRGNEGTIVADLNLPNCHVGTQDHCELYVCPVSYLYKIIYLDNL